MFTKFHYILRKCDKLLKKTGMRFFLQEINLFRSAIFRVYFSYETTKRPKNARRLNAFDLVNGVTFKFRFYLET